MSGFSVPRRVAGVEFERQGWSKSQGTSLLFRDGEWEIHDNPLQHPRLNPALSRVVHYCGCPRKGDSGDESEYCHVWSNLRGNKKCPACTEVMPESIQTLWTLQNFDVDFGHSDVSGRIT